MELSPKLKQCLKGVPEELQDIFVKDQVNSKALEDKYDKLARWQLTRDMIMDVQRRMGLPLRPNETPQKMKILIRLIQEKLRRDPFYDPDDNDDEDDD